MIDLEKLYIAVNTLDDNHFLIVEKNEFKVCDRNNCFNMPLVYDGFPDVTVIPNGYYKGGGDNE